MERLNPFREHINTKSIVGYDAERVKLADNIQSGNSIVTVEGEIGCGKTTVMRESFAKLGGIYVPVTTLSNIKAQISTQMPILDKIKKADPLDWICRDGRRVILYLDEIRLIEDETILRLKQAIPLNSGLTIVIAVTDSQLLELMDRFPELRARLFPENRVQLYGLKRLEVAEFIRSRSDIPFEPGVIDWVCGQANKPLRILQICSNLYDMAMRNKAKTVGMSLTGGAKTDTEVAPALTAQEAALLEIVDRQPGLKRGPLAKALGTSENNAGNVALRLVKKKLIVREHGRYYSLKYVQAKQAAGESILGA